jgi:hypothetical protein
MPVGAVFLAGLVGGLAFLLVLWDAIVGGVLDVPFLHALGALVAPHASERAAYGVGAGTHAALSIGFALAYAWVLDALGPATVGAGAALGLLIGLGHGIAATVVVAAMLARSRHVAEAAGSVALGSHPRGAAAAWILAHAVFGLTVGTVYAAMAW